MSIEDNFVMIDRDGDGNKLTFNMIEDESGDVFWGYGHIDPATFIGEVNRWLIHIGADPEHVFSTGEDVGSVERLWAKYENEDDERFKLVTARDLKVGETMFAVTRLCA